MAKTGRRIGGKRKVFRCIKCRKTKTLPANVIGVKCNLCTKPMVLRRSK